MFVVEPGQAEVSLKDEKATRVQPHVTVIESLGQALIDFEILMRQSSDVEITYGSPPQFVLHMSQM